ncbi:MAG TPA: aromatic acid exporter family protein [Bacilli bacterium]|nr:aromatic acid exporter family protein [Bacilli bacterium]
MAFKLRLTLFLKMFVGFLISFLIAYFFKLDYSFTAGVIAVLNLWYSKDTIIKTALLRFASGIIGIVISSLFLFIIGHSVPHLVVSVVVVLVALYSLKFEYGATIALVLVGQNFADFSIYNSLNALYILLIGTVPALILNLLVLRNPTFLIKDQQAIDHEISNIFKKITAGEEVDFTILAALRLTANQNIKVALENYAFKKFSAQIDYLFMREAQINVLEEIVPLYALEQNSPYKDKINSYLARFIKEIGFEDYATDLLSELEELYLYFQNEPLPTSRSEFEHRANLYVFIAQLKRFLELKLAFHAKYPEFTTFI